MTLLRWLLAGLLVAAGVSHLTWGRRGYRIVVPDWATRMLHTDKDAIVVGSGAVEIALGAGLVIFPRERGRRGAAIAAVFVAVFPGQRPPVAHGAVGADAGHRHAPLRQAPPPAVAGGVGARGGALSRTLTLGSAVAPASTSLTFRSARAWLGACEQC